MSKSLIKSILHNIGVLVVGIGVGLLGFFFDWLLSITRFYSPFIIVIAVGLLIIGFLIRVWATYYFYEHKMKVIKLEAQGSLITTGPYRFSRNPLYLGGNVFIFLGAVLFFGSPSGIVLTILGIIATDRMIRREERQLEQRFDEEWIAYKKKVRRWI